METPTPKNDIQLLDVLRKENWKILGFGFKDEETFTARSTNKRLWDMVTPWITWIASPSIDDKNGFWLAVKE